MHGAVIWSMHNPFADLIATGIAMDVGAKGV